MSSLNETKPIQLVYKENGDLKINQIALDQLIKIDKSIAVCICVGPYRQGKSFLLNTIFKGSNFGVGHEDEACTEGVWVYQCPVEETQNQSYTLLIMDVEGTESDTNCYGEMDTKLFLLAMLMSSMLIYNSKSALSGESLKKLAVVATIGDKIKTENSEKNFHNTQYKPTIDFVWTVRDFALLPKEDTPTNKLDKLLNPQEFIPNTRFNSETNQKKKEETIVKNQVIEAINNTFDQKICFYVPVPVSDGTAGLTYEEALQNLDKLPLDCLRDEFTNQIITIRNYILDNIQIKKVNDLGMNGPIFCEYLKQIVSNINKENVIYLNETINNCLSIIRKEALDKTVEFYSDKMNEKMSNGQFHKIKSFERLHKKIFERSVDFLGKKIKSYSESFQYECEDELAESSVGGQISCIYNRFSLINQSRIKQKNLDLGIEFFNGVRLIDLSFERWSQFKEWFISELKIKLFECQNFDQFWNELQGEIDFDKMQIEFEEKILQKNEKFRQEILDENKALKNRLENTECKKAYGGLTILQTDPANKIKHSQAIPLRVDGQPDLRYNVNRGSLVADDGTRLTKSGRPDMRYKENKIRFGKMQKF